MDRNYWGDRSRNTNEPQNKQAQPQKQEPSASCDTKTTSESHLKRHFAVPAGVPGREQNNEQQGQNQNQQQQSQQQGPNNQKSKLAAGLLGIFLGGLGIHNFYLGYTGKGIAQILLTLVGWCLCGIGPIVAAIWGLVEGVLILTGNISEDGKGQPLMD